MQTDQDRKEKNILDSIMDVKIRVIVMINESSMRRQLSVLFLLLMDFFIKVVERRNISWIFQQNLEDMEFTDAICSIMKKVQVQVKIHILESSAENVGLKIDRKKNKFKIFQKKSFWKGKKD